MDAELQIELEKIHSALARIEARLESPASHIPLRAKTALLPARGGVNLRWSPLMAHAEQIVAWMNQGKTQRQIVNLLAEQGLRTSPRSLNRFVRGRLRPDEPETA